MMGYQYNLCRVWISTLTPQLPLIILTIPLYIPIVPNYLKICQNLQWIWIIKLLHGTIPICSRPKSQLIGIFMKILYCLLWFIFAFGKICFDFFSWIKKKLIQSYKRKNHQKRSTWYLSHKIKTCFWNSYSFFKAFWVLFWGENSLYFSFIHSLSFSLSLPLQNLVEKTHKSGPATFVSKKPYACFGMTRFASLSSTRNKIFWVIFSSSRQTLS